MEWEMALKVVVDIEHENKHNFAETLAEKIVTTLHLSEEETNKYISVDLSNGWFLNITVAFDDEDDCYYYLVSVEKDGLGYVYRDGYYDATSLADDLLKWTFSNERINDMKLRSE